MRIFLLEDNTEVADSLIRIIDLKYDWEVVWATNLADARDVVKNESFDIAVLDFQLGWNDRGTELIPDLTFPYVGYSGLPDDFLRSAPQGAKAFSKGDPFALLAYLEEVAKG